MDCVKASETWAIIAAAGSGQRLGMAKQFLEWRGAPLYWHSVLAISASCRVTGVVLVFPASNVTMEVERVKARRLGNDPGIEIRVCAGGASRSESVRKGLEHIPQSCSRVLVHDAARPFLKPLLVNRVLDALEAPWGGVVPGLPVTDTIKILHASNGDKVEETLERDRLVAIQTPQVFWAEILRAAHQAGYGGQAVTDDAELVERLGRAIRVVPGQPDNIKITNPGDLKLLGASEPPTPVTGFGYDAHRFGAGRPLRLGGIPIGGDLEIVAHSDGDLLLHALADAILGCAGLGDIGLHFPDADPAFAGMSSAVIVDHALELARARGIKIMHVDLTIVAQKPKLAAFREQIRKNVARLLALPGEFVNFKATTEEGMGFTGRMEGIKAYALVNGLREKKLV